MRQAIWLFGLMLGCGEVLENMPTDAPVDNPVTPDDLDGDGLTNTEEAAGWDISVLAVGSTVREVRHVVSDPMKADTDGDGRDDAQEKAMLTDATLADTDLDGLTDSEEETALTDPTNFDTDGNRLLDATEHKGLIAQYRLDSVVAGKLLDSSGNGHDAVAAGNVSGFTAFTDRFNRTAHALYHAANGVNTNVNGWATVDVGAIDPQHWSVSLWINGHPVTGQVIGQPSSFAFASDVLTAGTQVASVRFVTSSVGGGNSEGVKYAEDQWHHWVATREGSAVDLYRDGTLTFSGTTTFAPAAPCGILMLWGWASTCVDTPGAFNAMDAALDDLRVWNRALTATEVAGLAVETASP